MLSPDEEQELRSKLDSLKKKQQELDKSKQNKAPYKEEKDFHKNPIHTGFEFAFTLLAFFFIGYWADQKINTEPWLTLIGFFIGFAFSLYRIIKTS